MKDTSTLDFVYMPSIASIEDGPTPAQRIPILGGFDGNMSRLSGSDTGSTEYPLMKPQIHAIGETGSDLSASPMSEVVDNHALEIDPFKLTETVGRSRSGENDMREKLMAGQTGQKGVIGELFSGMMDDILGGSSKPATASK